MNFHSLSYIFIEIIFSSISLKWETFVFLIKSLHIKLHWIVGVTQSGWMRRTTACSTCPSPVLGLRLASWLHLKAPSSLRPWGRFGRRASHSPCVSPRRHNTHHRWFPPEHSGGSLKWFLTRQLKQNKDAACAPPSTHSPMLLIVDRKSYCGA